MKKTLFLGLGALLAASFTSCKDDALTPDNSQVLENDTSFFVNIAVNSSEIMSRGDANPTSDYDPTHEPNFDRGNEVENNVQDIYLIFYDKNGNRVNTTQVRRDGEGLNKTDGQGSENALYSGVVQIDLKHGQLAPSYVLAFVNPIQSQNFQYNDDFSTLEKVEKTLRETIIDKGKFAMSKSVYYGKDYSKLDDPESGYKTEDQLPLERIMATPIRNGQLHSTREAAEIALLGDDSQKVDIFVERYAVKVNFSFSEGALKSIANNGNNHFEINGLTGNKYYLVFVPEYWAVNAYEPTTYITKSFFEVDDNGAFDFTKPASYEFMNNRLGKGSWLWNSETHHRSYWAQSPSYYTANYPRVADDILDKQFGMMASDVDRELQYDLGYYSYNNLVELAKNPGLENKSRKFNPDGTLESKDYPMIYARENTVSATSLKNAYKDPLQSPKAAIASVIVTGHYKLSTNGQEPVELKEDEIFYIVGNNVNDGILYHNYDSMLRQFMRIGIHFSASDNSDGEIFNYNPVDGTTPDFIEKYNDFKKYFTIEHPKFSVRKSMTGDVVLDSRFVTLQLDEDAVKKATNPIYAYIGGKYKKVVTDWDEEENDSNTEVDIIEVNVQLFSTTGTARGFQGGKAFFNIPIQHLGFYRKGNKNEEQKLSPNDKKFLWNEVVSGDFGLVRNHVYTIVADGITGLGNAIPDPDVPIVPPTDPEDYYIGARIIVLNWAVVPTQKVILK